MTSPLRVALVGAGDVGQLRAQAVVQTPGLDLAVVADVVKERAKRLAGRFGAEASTEPLSAVRRDDVHLVIVSTPPDRHAAISVAALSAGKHVLCEKPLAHTLADAERMCEAAEANGVLLKTGFNHRHFPAMAFARTLIDGGKIGEVVGVKAHAGHPGGEEFGHAWVHDGRVTGGGSLVDNGIHVLDLARFFLGEEVEWATGYVANLVWPFENAEDNGFALFRSASGKIAQVHASWTRWRGYHFWVETLGTQGYVRASYPPMLAEWGRIPEPGTPARRHYKVFPLFQVRERLRGWRWTIVTSFVWEMSAFVAGIRAGREAPATGHDGLRAMRMADAVYRASREGREVAV